MANLLQDLRYALRSPRRSPAFTLGVSVLTGVVFGLVPSSRAGGLAVGIIAALREA